MDEGEGTLTVQAAPGGATTVALSPTLRSTIRRVTAEASVSETEGEDDLDSFPLPPEARQQELAAVRAASGATETAVPAVASEDTPVVTEAATTTAVVPAVPVDPSITRFHQEIGLLPKSDNEPLPDIVEVSADGGSGDGGSGAGDDGPQGDGEEPRGRRRRGLMEIEDRPMTIFEHLDELRRRLVWAGLAFIVGTGITLPFIQSILQWSLRNAHAANMQLQAISPLEPMVASVKLAILGGLILGSPVILYQALAYVLPALSRNEKRLLFTYLPAALVLFGIGLSFGLLVFEPLAVRMSSGFLQASLVPYHITLNNWIGYLIGFSVPFGLLFELPVIVSIVVRLGIIVPDTLAAGRRWAFLVAIVIAVMFAPPLDFIVTPTVVALPLYGLYELSILVARISYRQVQRQQLDAE